MHFLAETVEDKYPEIAGFENEMSHIEAAGKGQHFQAQFYPVCHVY